MQKISDSIKNVCNFMKTKIFFIKKKISYNEEVVNEFKQNAKAFSGLYEPLCMLSDGRLKRKTGLLNDWQIRISNLSNAQELKKLWEDIFNDYENSNIDRLKEMADSFIIFLFFCGVKRENIEDLVVDSKTYTKYSLLDDELVEMGNIVTIKTPCWTLNDDIIEKGTVVSKNNL